LKAKVIETRHFKNDIFYIKMECMSVEINPFQFLSIRIPDSGTIFRRPFSIFDFIEGEVSVLIKKVGKGTEFLSNIKINESLDVLIPLGNSDYRNIELNTKILFLAGGIGLAGIHAFYKKQNERNLVFGDKDGEYRDVIEHFDIKCEYYTETGKNGIKGFATDSIEKKEFDSIIACGPFAMFKTIKNKINSKKRFYAVCEEIMACGAGLCNGCTVKFDDGTFKKICTEGPLLDGARIMYE